MPLTRDRAVEQTRILLRFRDAELNGEDGRPGLTKLHAYLRGRQRIRFLDSGVPDEVRRLADISIVNVLKLVVDAVVQSMFVDGFRALRESDNQPAWQLWQSNKMDKRQIGIHRAGLAFGASYATVLPGEMNGEQMPVVRGASPRMMTVVYGGDDDWPMWALEKRRSATRGQHLYRLFDDTHAYWMSVSAHGDKVEWISDEEHDVGVVPVIRFTPTDDLDDEVLGEIEPLIPLQDQIIHTTFGLLVAQHYGAFRQRYILGWLAEDEKQKLKATAGHLWTFEHGDEGNKVTVGEFAQTDLKGYIESREATLRHVATISQTPVHELLGQLVNLAAEALVAARESADRKITERKTSMGESHEQWLGLGGEMLGVETDPSAWVRWRDTEARSLAQTADALGKLVQMLGVPPQELWERVPGVTDQEIQQWKAAAENGNAFADLEALFARQANDGA